MAISFPDIFVTLELSISVVIIISSQSYNLQMLQILVCFLLHILLCAHLSSCLRISEMLGSGGNWLLSQGCSLGALQKAVLASFLPCQVLCAGGGGEVDLLTQIKWHSLRGGALSISCENFALIGFTYLGAPSQVSFCPETMSGETQKLKGCLLLILNKLTTLSFVMTSS